MKLFKKVKEIKSKSGEMHFERWAIIETKRFAWYLHRIHKADQDHLHSHPWNFYSLILKGRYLEEVFEGTNNQNSFTYDNVKEPFQIAYTNKRWFHKIKQVLQGPVYTTVFVYGGSFEGDKWHYLVDYKAIPFTEYRELKTKAKERGISIEALTRHEKLSRNYQRVEEAWVQNT